MADCQRGFVVVDCQRCVVKHSQWLPSLMMQPLIQGSLNQGNHRRA